MMFDYTKSRLKDGFLKRQHNVACQIYKTKGLNKSSLTIKNEQKMNKLKYGLRN